MKVTFENFVNEEFFGFKNKKFYFEPIENSLLDYTMRYVEETEDAQVLLKLQEYFDEYYQIPDPPESAQQLDKQLALGRKINDIVKPITLRAYLSYARTKLVGKEIEVNNKRMKAISFDVYQNNYGFRSIDIVIVGKKKKIVSLSDFIKIKVKKEINRLVSKEDPYGEEVWDE